MPKHFSFERRHIRFKSHKQVSTMQIAAIKLTKNLKYSTKLTIDKLASVNFLVTYFYRKDRFKHILIYAN